MQFPTPLVEGTLLRRYKRFFAEVLLDDGQTVTAHVAATGSMKGCSDPGSRVGVLFQPDPKRTLRWSLELVQNDGIWIAVNTARPNRVVEEAIQSAVIPELRGYGSMRREVKYGTNSRIDLLLESGELDPKPPCYVEVKGVTMIEGRRGLFPDAVTERGTKHLLELQSVAGQGARAVLFFLVLRSDCACVAPADAIDPLYAQTLRQVAQQGVEVLAYATRSDNNGIVLTHRVPVVLSLSAASDPGAPDKAPDD